ncbi:MAG: hypothetical protein RIT28_1093 [Pseudomonadota bacterium]
MNPRPKPNREAQARAAVARFGVMDPSAWGTGLSDQGAREALRVSADLILDGRFGEAPNEPPAKLLIWCAANVFTAPLEWTARFAAWGSQVTLKAPSACPAPVEALAQAFAPLGVVAVNRPHAACWDLVAQADAVLGFGGDEAMAELAAHIPAETPRSLHGHRVSLAVVTEDDAATAKALAMDLCLYDGQGCMSPAAIFCLGDPMRLAERLGDELFDMTTRLPRGEATPGLGAERRRRIGLASALGRAWEGEDWLVTVTPARTFSPVSYARLAAIHPIDSLDALSSLPPQPWSSLGTDLYADAAAQLAATLGVPRVCRPGELQRPRFGRLHDGVNVEATLCRSPTWAP